MLTYNVQFRSFSMEAGAQGNPFPHTSVEERAHAVADRILASPQQYDVVLLQEVFDEDGRKILSKRLGRPTRTASASATARGCPSSSSRPPGSPGSAC